MIKIFKLEDIAQIALDLHSKIESLKTDGSATVVTLSGDLGVGKTSVTKALALIYGVSDNVISPTFVIMKSYTIHDSLYKNLVHIDAYRIESDKEMEVIGWKEIISNPENLVIVEWPEKILNLVPENSLNINIKHIDENTREITM